MGSRWTYTVTHYDKDSTPTAWASQDITDPVDSLPVFTDVSGGQINTAVIEIDASLGHYTRRERASESGFPTVIDHNDRIRIQVDDNVNTPYNQVFEVVRKIPLKSKGGGTKLRLECEGIERHLQKIKYIKPFYFATPSDAITDLIAFYNGNKTTDMPTVTVGTNELPNSGVHHFDWGINEDSVYNRITELVDLMGSASGAGGLLDFYDFRFTYSAANVTSITLDIFSSGSPSSGSEVTIDADTVNTGGEEAGGIEEAEGTVIGAWGANEAGSLPIDYSRFKSRQQLLPSSSDSLFPEHDATLTYPEDAIVQKDGTTYQANTQTSNTPTHADWTELTPASYYGTVIQYSPWTKDKANHWKNGGADPTGTGTWSTPMMFDGNIIINDDETFRTWVDVETSGGAPPATWTYTGIGAAGYYDGFRVLVNGVGTGPFAGTDPNGIDYDFNVCEYRAADDEWYVKYNSFNANGADGDLDSMQVAIFESGRVKVWNNPTTGAWNDISTSDNGTDCFHPYDSIGQTTSVHTDPDRTDEVDPQFQSVNNGSGIKATYSWSPVIDWTSNTFNARTSAGYYKSGAWLGFRWPFPKNNLNSIGNDTGDIYGGGAQGVTIKEPTAIDAQNMHLTHNGYRGFNTSSSDTLESEDYGQLSSVDFFMKLIFQDGNNVQLPKGNFKMRAWFFDKSDHVVYQDFVIQFNNNWESIKLPLSGFQIYRGRRPRYDTAIIGLNDLIPPRGIASDEVFEWRHVVGFCVGTLDSYDSFGRYQAGLGDFGVMNFFNFTNRKIELWLDGFRFTKPLLALTDAVSNTTLVKNPDFLQYPEVGNYEQLDNIAKSELEKARFKKTEYDIENEILTDINYGDFFFFTDDEIVPDSDNGDNVVKLVNKGTEYSITKPIDGRGGALRRIRGSRRFV